MTRQTKMKYPSTISDNNLNIRASSSKYSIYFRKFRIETDIKNFKTPSSLLFVLFTIWNVLFLGLSLGYFVFITSIKWVLCRTTNLRLCDDYVTVLKLDWLRRNNGQKIHNNIQIPLENFLTKILRIYTKRRLVGLLLDWGRRRTRWTKWDGILWENRVWFEDECAAKFKCTTIHWINIEFRCAKFMPWTLKSRDYFHSVISNPGLEVSQVLLNRYLILNKTNVIFWLQSDVLPSPLMHEFVVKQPIAIKRHHIFSFFCIVGSCLNSLCAPFDF